MEALSRRAFALPFISGRHGKVDLTALDPADPAERRLLIEFEHPGAGEEHLEGHERLTALLWAGDPPELWDTAQTMLDLGWERHEILHRLIDVMDLFGDDPAEFRASLRALRHDRPAN
jgi:hypothetical protein